MTRGALRSRLGRILTTRASHTAGTTAPTDTPALVATPPVSAPTAVVPSERRVEQLQQALGIRFSDPALLREALTHRSYLNETDQEWPSNERLEFMGDAVLGLISTDYLFHRFPEHEEGDLTNLRSALVRTETLARFAQEINLGQYLYLGRGEEMSRGRQRAGGLACAFEALLAAIYQDRGYEEAQRFALRFLQPQLESVVEGRLHKNAKSVLQETVQARMQQTPSYHLIEESGPDHAKTFTVEVRVGNRVLGRGHERSKRGAEQAAAEAALQSFSSRPSKLTAG